MRGDTSLPLDVQKGDHVVGRLEEVDGEDFDWYIVDEKNLVAMKNNENVNVVDEGYDKTAYAVDLEVASDGPWFLVLDLPRRQYARTIEVNLRHYGFNR